MTRRLLLLVAVVAVGLTGLALAEPGEAVPDYTSATRQPCIACHTTGSGPDLNARGQAFAAIPTHKTEPVAAWAEVEQTMPSATPTPTVGGDLIVPILVGALFVGATAYLLAVQARRRRS